MKQIINKATPIGNVLMKKAKYFFMAAVFLAFTSVCFAQDEEDPGEPGGDPDTNVPFDGGVSLLVAAGIGYGAKKAYDAKRKDTAVSVEEGTAV